MDLTPATPNDDVIALLVREHGDAIIWKLVRKGFSRDEAEDASQDTWQKVAQYLSKGGVLRATQRHQVRAWLLKIALRMALESRRKIRLENSPWTAADEARLANRKPDLFTEICRREDIQLVRTAIKQLSDKQLLAVQMFLVLENQSKVAQRLGITEPAVGQLLKRAKARLKITLCKDSQS